MEKRRIAVIEDEATIADSVAARLRAEGFEVETAGDGHAGVELCRRFRPDLVVLDLMLPGIDGLEVCRRIQRDRELPVLMLAALPPHLRAEALRPLAIRLEEREPWSSFNSSRDGARELLATLDD